MSLARRDDYLTNALGQALSGALVYYCTQPANTSVSPPTPLASVYADLAGTPALNPQVSDGFGHTTAYLDNTQLYTIVFVHPEFLLPIILPDQTIGGGSGGIGLIPYQETPMGTIDGVNTTFTLTFNPVQATIWNNFSLVPGIGYMLSGKTLTFANPPQPGDTLFAQYLTSFGLGGAAPTPITAPAFSLNAVGVGTGATFSLSPGSNALCGVLTITTGSGPYVGAVLVGTFIAATPAANQTLLYITPRNVPTAQSQLFAGATNATNAQLTTAVGLAAHTTFELNYQLLQI